MPNKLLVNDTYLSFEQESVRLLRDGYSEQLFLLTDKREQLIVRKQAKPEIKGTLLAEIAWLEELPASLHRYFPRVLHSSKTNGNGQALFYDMPYFGDGWVLLSELILTQALDPVSILALITQVMQVMFGSIYPAVYPEEERDYAERLVYLLERCAQQISQLPAFSSRLRADTVMFNGMRLWNLFSLLEHLKSTPLARERLRPTTVRKVHGDLYPENVLVYLPSLRRQAPRVMLLDPVAAVGLSRGDFAMDVAKFKSWLSAELLALRLELFSVREERGSVPTFQLRLHTEDAPLQVLSDERLLRSFAHQLDTAQWARAVCDPDPSWWQRVSFYEALYALTMVALVPFPQSLARFLVGLRHLHNFVCGE